MRMDPKFSLPYYTRSLVRFEQGNYDAEIDDLNTFNRLSPSAPGYNSLGNAYQYKGQYDRAIDAYDRAVKLDPKDFHAYMNRGRTRLLKGNLAEAIVDLNLAVAVTARSNNESDTPYVFRGDVYRYKG